MPDTKEAPGSVRTIDHSAPDDIVGHITLADGSHEPLKRSDAEKIMRAVEANEDRKAKMMPTSFEAVHLMFDAYDRLRQLGWSSGIYCPKDGTSFAIIEHGSTGVFTGSYYGKWPDGKIIAEDCVLSPDGLLWKPLEKLTEWEQSARIEAAKATSEHIERMGRMVELEDNANA